MSDEIDQRPIAEMSFGHNLCPPTTYKSEKWEPTPAQEREQEWVRSTLQKCGCRIADDINQLGCTGIVQYFSASIGVTTRLRLGLAGGGVGLPCFVPPTRFCLGHNTTGGLQDRQKQLHPEYVNAISRELTPTERAGLALTEHARGIDEGSISKTGRAVADLLGGRRTKDVAAAMEGIAGVEGGAALEADEVAEVADVRPRLKLWKCDEHTTTNWACRYCLAQAIVEGPLVPTFVCHVDNLDTDEVVCSPSELEEKLADNMYKAQVARVYALAASFTRKLARD